ncbi:MAG: hypothetical protein IPK19_24105 [Chloroflexi bacterium]|nr:hypothetical protein [Chloroflexota bacterium]
MCDLPSLVLRRTVSRVAALALLLSLILGRLPTAFASTFTIPCTAGVGDTAALVAALAAAGSNGEPDTLSLGEACAYESAVLLNVQADAGYLLTILGNGSALLSIDDGDPTSSRPGLLAVDPSAKVEIRDLTVRDSFLTAVTNRGELTMRNVVLEYNFGNAVDNYGLLNMQRSSVRNGGSTGLFNVGIASLANTTFHSNSGSPGIVTNMENAILFLYNVTISQNTVPFGVGLANTGTALVDNSIIANNVQGNECLNLPGSTFMARNTLVEDHSCGALDGSNGNKTGIDPNLEAATPTALFLRPLEGSPVIDAGSNSLIPVGADRDQANRPRILNTVVDMGAYEYAPPTSLTVQLNLQGRANPPGNTWIANTRVEVRPSGGGAPYQTIAQTSNTFGRIFLSDLFPGAYDLWIKTDRTLAKIVPVLLTPGDSLTGIGDPLREGDADDSNSVTITDFSILAAAFGAVSGGAGYDARADFNGDAAVNISDFSLLASNFGESGVP